MVTKRWRLSPTTMIFAAAGLLIALLGVVIVVATAGQDPVTQRVRRFDSTIVLNRDGSMHVTETITYDFADSTTSHGIERWLPLATGHDATHDRLYRLTHAEARSPSGAPSTLSVGDGASTTMRIGDPGTIVTGVQTYQLDYDVTGVVAAGTGGQQVDWDVTGGAWRVPVDKATVFLRGPAPVLHAECHEGSVESPRTCTPVLADGAVTDTAETVLLPGQGLRITAGFAAGTFPETPPELISKWSWGRAFSVTPLTVGAAAALLLALTAWPVTRAVRTVRRRRSASGSASRPASRPGDGAPPRPGSPGQEPSRPLPPQQVGVGELILLADPDRDGQAVAATIIDLAGRGRITIEEIAADPDGIGAPAGWRLIRGEQRSSQLRSYERGVFGKVFGPGSRVRLADLGPQLFGFHAPVATGLADAGAAQGGVTPMIWSAVAAAVLGVFGLVGTILLAALSSWGLVGVALLLAAAVVLFAGLVARRRVPGPVQGPSRADLKAQARDFRRYLEQLEADTIRFEESHDSYLGYLPYAVAFDRVDRWVSVLTELVRSGVRVTAPAWYLPAGTDPARTDPARPDGQGFDPGRFGDAILAFVDEVVYLVENGTSSAEDDADEEPGDEEGAVASPDRDRDRAWDRETNPHRSAFGPTGPTFGGPGSSSGGSGSSGSSASSGGGSGSW
jgi:uncharacterized membrane protein YgcG